MEPEFWSNPPPNLMQPFLNPNDATHKIWSRLANWHQRYLSSKVWNFRKSRASNSKMSGLIWPKIELDRDFMPVLVISNLMHQFPHPSNATHKIWSRLANWLQRFSSVKVWTATDGRRTVDGPLVYYKLTLWAFGSGELKTYKWDMETRGPKSNSSELLCLSWLPATLMMIRSKMNELAWRHHFPIISLWEIF